jgi:hypothetical protein
VRSPGSRLSVELTVGFNPRPMKVITHRWIALLLQGVVALVGLAALTFLLVEPHLEGVNAHRTPVEIYFHDPFLAYVYAGSSAFFVALYRAFGLLGGLKRTGAVSAATLAALLSIRRCGFVLLGFVAGGTALIFCLGDPEDRPPGMAMCLLAFIIAGGIAFGASRFARSVGAALPSGELQGR